MKILCHVGPWCVKQYLQIARSVDVDAQISLISHFRKIDETGMADLYYQNVASGIKTSLDIDIDPTDFIERCRLLRSLTREEALLHLFSMHKAISDTFDRERPDIVISETIDQYLIDLLKFECNKRKIPFFGLVVSFVNGYFRITSRGEKGLTRNVSNTEVKKVMSEMEQASYVPNFVSLPRDNLKRNVSIFKRMASNWLRVPFFFLKRHCSGEKYNYHYWASQISAQNSLHVIPAFKLGERDWKDLAIKSHKTIIYHPLQFYPEATIEYWCDCLKDIDYETKLVDIVRSMSGQFHFLIKEHPNAVGNRSPALYKALENLDNVTFVPVNVASNTVSDVSSATLIWTGSAGFEAALRGKPVLTICEPYYMFGDKFKKIDEHIANDAISNHIDSNSGELNNVDKYNLVSNLLSVLKPGRYVNDASWSAGNPDHMRQALQIGQEIKKDLSRA